MQENKRAYFYRGARFEFEVGQPVQLAINGAWIDGRIVRTDQNSFVLVASYGCNKLAYVVHFAHAPAYAFRNWVYHVRPDALRDVRQAFPVRQIAAEVKPCDWCEGTGYDEDHGRRCWKCEGTRVLVAPRFERGAPPIAEPATRQYRVPWYTMSDALREDVIEAESYDAALTSLYAVHAGDVAQVVGR